MTETLQAGPRHIVYMAFGDDKYLKQTNYSLLTLLHFLDGDDRSDNIKVLLYTDSPARFPVHPRIELRKLDKEEIRSMKGKYNYVHRVKLAVLDEVVRRVDGPVIYVDCDTKWIRSPEDAFARLEAGSSMCFMHVYESDLSSDCFSSYLDALVRHPEICNAFGIAPPWRIWNAGVVGIPAGHVNFFSETIDLTDQLFGTVENGNWIEQLAVSVMASRDFRIEPFAPYLQHFWQDTCILEPVVESALQGCCGDIVQDARHCAEYPFEEVLKKKRNSLEGHFRKRLLKLKRSLAKRQIHRPSSAE